jgi:hypothetical protein
VSGGEWNTTRERKALQRDQREQEREQIRLEKRQLRDLRWAIERSTIEASDWQDLLALQSAHGREGPIQLWRELIPYWRDCQRINGGAGIPAELFPQATGLFSRGADSPAAPVNRAKPGKGASRKVRSDSGKARPSRKVRSPQG